MYRVLVYFTDLQDNGHAYHAGDIFPREGLAVTQKRFDELASDENRRKKPLIEKVDQKESTEKPEAEQEEKPKRKSRKKE